MISSLLTYYDLWETFYFLQNIQLNFEKYSWFVLLCFLHKQGYFNDDDYDRRYMDEDEMMIMTMKTFTSNITYFSFVVTLNL